MRRDLFSEQDDGYFEDVKLVHNLALRKLEAKAGELAATWQWAKPMLEPDYGFTAEYARVHRPCAALVGRPPTTRLSMNNLLGSDT